MSKLYDTIEPAVIDEQMLKQCVEEQGPKDEAGRIANQEGIDFNEVLHLRLDFKNILKIDNLWSFTNLVRLQLDNNIIEKIEGLNTLVNLKWLDLSFNNIEIIEGLDKLTQLTDLTLFSNRIARIENMDALKELQVVSFGNNLLKSLENIAYLRRFKNLRTINLSGNPFSEDDNYKSYIIAHLPSVIYLDYRLVDESLRHQARDQYEFSIVELEQEERELENKMIKEKAIEERLQKEKRAYVEYLDGPELFDQMVADDPEASKLSYLPGLADVTEGYPNINS
ncbi:Dynein regulatory complex subunit 3 [Trichoplax sp. H2]|nr:Dynein regulatory complex subunit 3 [Trichoplax sp. H2]|eukprot:RDD37073.1 Dynein regulatory complex subunit 3 [Trichoplax sp. H2]